MNIRQKAAVLLLKLVSLFFTSSSFAIPVGFLDYGDSTIQVHSQLEWLDVTQTRNRSYDSIFAELNSGTGLGAPDQNWRYATRADFNYLISDWFNITYNGEWLGDPSAASGNDNLVNLFVKTFGDVREAEWLQRNYELQANAGLTQGFLGEASNQFGDMYRAIVEDNELYVRATGEFHSDDPDFVQVSGSQPASTVNPQLGSWLVRDVTYVPLPPALYLFGSGLLGLIGISRRKKAA